MHSHECLLVISMQLFNNYMTSVACQLSEHHGSGISRGHSPAASSITETERLTVTSGDSQWMELSRKRSASGSCLSPHGSKSPLPTGRSKHILYIICSCSSILVIVGWCICVSVWEGE